MSYSLPSIENWQDFALAYVPAVNAFRHGFLPYGNFYYPYPPLFLYALTVPSLLSLPAWSSALPLVLADALTVVPVYLIAHEFADDRHGIVASAAFVLAPVNLFYVDYLWLNPSPTTLFLMVSVYFLVKRRYDLSAVSLALSIGFKQTALLALPVMMLILWRSQPRGRTALRYFAIVASICLAISVPYIFLASPYYLDSVFSVPSGLWSVSYYPPDYWSLAVGNGTQVTFNTLVSLTSRWQALAGIINAPVNLGLPIFIFLTPVALSWIYSSVYSVLQWIILLGSYATLLTCIWRNKEILATDSMRYVLYAFLVFFVFYPLYKYYAVGLIPIFALLIRSRKDLLGFAAFNLTLLLIPRYFASWVLFVPLLWLIRKPLLLSLHISRRPQGVPHKDRGRSVEWRGGPDRAQMRPNAVTGHAVMLRPHSVQETR